MSKRKALLDVARDALVEAKWVLREGWEEKHIDPEQLAGDDSDTTYVYERASVMNILADIRRAITYIDRAGIIEECQTAQKVWSNGRPVEPPDSLHRAIDTAHQSLMLADDKACTDFTWPEGSIEAHLDDVCIAIGHAYELLRPEANEDAEPA